jgi:hypothetical protein
MTMTVQGTLRSCCSLMVLFALLGANHAARAQWDAYQNMNIGDSGLFQPIIHQDFSSPRGDGGKSLTDIGRFVYREPGLTRTGARGAAFADPQTLHFSRSRNVSRSVRGEIVELMARKQPHARSQLEAELERADPVAEFNRMIDRYGYDPGNFAHVMSAFLIIQWEVATGQTAVPAQMEGAVAQIESALLQGPLMVNMSDADKQAVAESMAYQASLAAAIQNDLVRKRDTRKLAALRRGVAVGTRELGWDFDRVELTARGFVPR